MCEGLHPEVTEFIENGKIQIGSVLITNQSRDLGGALGKVANIEVQPDFGERCMGPSTTFIIWSDSSIGIVAGEKVHDIGNLQTLKLIVGILEKMSTDPSL